jgi:flagellar basal body P-ring formation protein FlgA
MRKFLFALPLLFPTPAAAQAFEDLDVLDRRLAETGASAEPVDRRLKLAACPQPATIEPPIGAAVTVRCPALGWRIRIPLIGGASRASQLLVRKGDVVELAFSGRGFDVVTSATAQEDGEMGGWVRVKAQTGASFLTARVRGTGSVVVGD